MKYNLDPLWWCLSIWVLVNKPPVNHNLDFIVQLCDFLSSRSLRRVRRDVVSPHDALRLLKQPRGDTRSAVRSADYMEQTFRLLHDRVHHVHKRSLNATGQTWRQNTVLILLIWFCLTVWGLLLCNMCI